MSHRTRRGTVIRSTPFRVLFYAIRYLLSYPRNRSAHDANRRTDGPRPEVRIGERLRFYRQAKGKTQAVVAGLAGATEDYLSQIERGLKTPTLPLVHRFSKILGVRVSELLGESATEHDERVLPVGYAVQRALMSYSGSDDAPDLVSLRGRVDAAFLDPKGGQLRRSNFHKSVWSKAHAKVGLHVWHAADRNP
jgi:transcriptional regulator with XRE-family HTH domain